MQTRVLVLYPLELLCLLGNGVGAGPGVRRTLLTVKHLVALGVAEGKDHSCPLKSPLWAHQLYTVAL